MHEYKVVPAPAKATKVKGLKTTAERFAHALTTVLNDHSAEGWEFVRTETYTVEDKPGLLSRAVRSTQTFLILRREKAVQHAAPPLTARPPVAAPVPVPAPAAEPAPTATVAPAPEPAPAPVVPAPAPPPEDQRPEPVFRPGSLLRSDGPRKYPPLRRTGADGPIRSDDSR